MRNQILTFQDTQMYRASRADESDWPLTASYPKMTGSSAIPLRKPRTQFKTPSLKKSLPC